MELFVLKLVSIICATLIALTIIIIRKDDIGLGSIIIAILFIIIIFLILYINPEQIISIVNNFKNM